MGNQQQTLYTLINQINQMQTINNNDKKNSSDGFQDIKSTDSNARVGPKCGCCKCDTCTCDPCNCCQCDPCNCNTQIEDAPKKTGCCGDKKEEPKKVEEAPKKTGGCGDKKTGGCGCGDKKKAEVKKPEMKPANKITKNCGCCHCDPCKCCTCDPCNCGPKGACGCGSNCQCGTKPMAGCGCGDKKKKAMKTAKKITKDCACCSCDPCNCDPCQCCTCDPCNCGPKAVVKAEEPKKKGGCGCGSKKVEKKEPVTATVDDNVTEIVIVKGDLKIEIKTTVLTGQKKGGCGCGSK